MIQELARFVESTHQTDLKTWYPPQDNIESSIHQAVRVRECRTHIVLATSRKPARCPVVLDWLK